MKNNTLTTKLFLAIAIIFAVVMKAGADTVQLTPCAPNAYWGSKCAGWGTVTFTSQWGEFKLYGTEISTSDYKAVKITYTDAVDAQILVVGDYSDGNNQEAQYYTMSSAESKTLEFSLTNSNNVEKIEIQGTSTSAQVTISAVSLIKSDDSEVVLTDPVGTVWGCSYVTNNIYFTNSGGEIGFKETLPTYESGHKITFNIAFDGLADEGTMSWKVCVPETSAAVTNGSAQKNDYDSKYYVYKDITCQGTDRMSSSMDVDYDYTSVVVYAKDNMVEKTVNNITASYETSGSSSGGESGDEESATTYTATFDVNGTTSTFTSAEGAIIVAPEVERENYIFTGWSPALPITMPAESKTYTAQYTKFEKSADEKAATARMANMDLTAAEMAHYMAPAWNLGNTMEAGGYESRCYKNDGTDTETWWQGTKTSKELIDYVKSQGFKSVRIPCAWVMGHITDADNMTIDPNWITRVKEVIQYCLDDGLYVVINDHWDGGWLEYDGFTESADTVALGNKLGTLWTNIATALGGYDERVIFAGMNEPGVGGEGPNGGTLIFSQYGTSTEAQSTRFAARLQYYEQIFINAVRATATDDATKETCSNNAKRILAVQGPKTEITMTADYFDITKLTDSASDRLMVEVHFYEPYQFCQMTEDASWGKMQYYWAGSDYNLTTSHKGSYDNSSIISSLAKMKTKFVDNGYPVILGEYSTFWRQISGDGESQYAHNMSLQYWYDLVTKAAMQNGIIPFQWDTNICTYGGCSCIDRTNNSEGISYVMDGIQSGATAGEDAFKTIYPTPAIIALTDDNPTLTAGTYAAGELAYTRTIKEGYATFVVPFDVDLTPYKDVAFTKAWVFKDNAAYIDETQNLIKVKADEVSLTSKIPAGTLFITKCKDLSLTLKNSTETELTGKEVPNDIEEVSGISDLEIKVLGSYKKVTGLDKTYYRAFHASNGKFGPTTFMYPFRVYVYKYGSAATLAKYSIAADFSGDGDATIIDGPENVISDINAPAYNMVGQRVKADAKGIVIINGKKTFNK